MTNSKIELGDFQTPDELTDKIVLRLKEFGINPPTIIEPTSGEGHFIVTARKYFPKSHIFGLEINKTYISELQAKLKNLKLEKDITLIHQDFFLFDWEKFLDEVKEPILFLGNPPWVTNSKLGQLDSSNLPPKINYQKHSGIDAITGKSNFDISEWMLLKMIEVMNKKKGYLAMLVKTSVARKVLLQIWNNHDSKSSDFKILKIDSKKHFNISAEACLFVCNFSLPENSKSKTCQIYDSLDSTTFSTIGISNGRLINDIETYNSFSNYFEEGVFKSHYIWRTGVKHDLSKVLEIDKKGNELTNGFGESIDIEEEYLYPLMKSSDVSNDRTVRKLIIIPQKAVNEDTLLLESKAPRLWKYLNKYEEYFNKRKSSIYNKKSKFAIFGIGEYSFSKWKIAISGMYKRLTFVLIPPYENKPVLFDDTVNFIPFNSYESALKTLDVLNKQETLAFLNSIIFWDAKRPITTSVLNHLNIENAISYYEKSNNPS